MTDSSRRRSRRTRSNLTEGEWSKPVLLEEELEISDIPVTVEKKSYGVMIGEVDQIRAELVEERGSALWESDYWDETHSWGSDDEEESDEYWHFLGRYE
ncbi:MAG: hypothetical protein QNJ34_27460 [Xenococcaceae cyanobacterium MO_188.B29]|nr:hypothetical protein [Xenococcaceae cyanobacterium MO_188.B29]